MRTILDIFVVLNAILEKSLSPQIVRWATIIVGFALVVSTTATVWSDFQHIIESNFVSSEPELPAKIHKLTESLNAAAESIGQIEGEIKKRQSLVEQLEQEANTATKLASLNQEQLNAVAQVLRGEIKSDERQNFWSAQLFAFFYAALGVALSELYRFIVRSRARRKLELDA
jgi:hypothetical protein